MRRKIDNPQNITLSQFLDVHGYWATRWEFCVRVYLEFGDGREPMTMTPKEFEALPLALREIINAAPSSRPSVVHPTAQVIDPAVVPIE